MNSYMSHHFSNYQPIVLIPGIHRHASMERIATSIWLSSGSTGVSLCRASPGAITLFTRRELSFFAVHFSSS